jgi:hypothetical protein
LLPAASALGAFSGLCVSCSLWWPTDPIAGPWVPISVAVNTTLALLVALIAGMTVRTLRLSTATHRRAAWLTLAGCVALGPVALALTPPLVAHRIALNDRAADERFQSLRTAVQHTASDANGQLICDGSVLQRYYSGPRFSQEDWRRITANYVKQDGYFFMVYCHEQGGYTIHAMPARHEGDGTRHFCTDESGRIGILAFFSIPLGCVTREDEVGSLSLIVAREAGFHGRRVGGFAVFEGSEPPAARGGVLR